MKQAGVIGVAALVSAALIPIGAASARPVQVSHRGAVLKAAVKASDGRSGDMFGASVAISGNTVVVGAPNRKVGHHKKQGAVYVFQRSGSGWSHLTQKAVLVAGNGHAKDLLGYSVAISGSTVVAGAPLHSISGNKYQGATYVWTRPAGGWSHASKPSAVLTDSDGAGNDQFGTSVAISGGTIISGAPAHVVGFHHSQGAIYLYSRPAAGWHGTISEHAELTASEGQTGDQLGRSVAIDGDTVVGGAPYHFVGTQLGVGAAFVFVKSSAGWAHTTDAAMLSARNGSAKDYFGDAVALSGSTIAIDAPDRKVDGNANQGAAYIFSKPTGGWHNAHHQQATLTTKPGATNAFSGLGIAISGNDVIVSGYGLASIFTRPTKGWSGTRHQSAALVGKTPGDFIGKSVAASGRTIIAGAPTVFVGQRPSQNGAAYIYVR